MKQISNKELEERGKRLTKKNKDMDNWDKAYKNTKTKVFNNEYGKHYLKTCKKCDSVVNNSPTIERQILGNCMQQITVCNECENTFVLDCNQNYNYFIKNFKN